MGAGQIASQRVEGGQTRGKAVKKEEKTKRRAAERQSYERNRAEIVPSARKRPTPLYFVKVRRFSAIQMSSPYFSHGPALHRVP